MEINVLWQNIRKIIKSKKITQEQMGEILGVDQSQISKWLTGKHVMGADIFLQIIEMTGAPFSDFVEGVIKYNENSISKYEEPIDSIAQILAEPLEPYFPKDSPIQELTIEIKALKRQMRDVQKKLSEIK